MLVIVFFVREKKPVLTNFQHFLHFAQVKRPIFLRRTTTFHFIFLVKVCAWRTITVLEAYIHFGINTIPTLVRSEYFTRKSFQYDRSALYENGLRKLQYKAQ